MTVVTWWFKMALLGKEVLLPCNYVKTVTKINMHVCSEMVLNSTHWSFKL